MPCAAQTRDAACLIIYFITEMDMRMGAALASLQLMDTRRRRRIRRHQEAGHRLYLGVDEARRA